MADRAAKATLIDPNDPQPANVALYGRGPDGTLRALSVNASGELELSAEIASATFIQSAQGRMASATFTPAAASHTAGDVNGSAAEFALAAPSGSEFLIMSADLEIDGGTAEATAWRLYLYSVTPPSAYADDAAWDLPSGDRASYLGYVDLGTAIDLGATQWVETHGINKAIKLADTSVFGYLVNLTTLTPAAVAHIVRLHGSWL